MFKFFATSVLFIGTLYISVAQQEVLWADKVIDVSSELTPQQYGAKQALGKPDVFPNPAESPNAWTPSRPDKNEYIHVGFEKAIPIRQIMIAESFNPTAVEEIFVYDASGKEYLINKLNPQAMDITGRPLNIFFEPTPYEVASVKITFSGKAVPGYFSIDAIGISNSEVPITIEVNVSEEINPNVVPIRLSENVNSEYPEFRPLLSPDGKTLFFSRRNHPDNIGGEDDMEDIWYSEWSESQQDWTVAKNMGPKLNNKEPNFISSITPDGNSVILILGNEYRGKNKMKAGVSISRKVGDGWSDPEPLEIENNYNTSESANFYMANNRRTLIMSVERNDSRGGRDLYVSFLLDDGTWSEPLNLGDDLNTASEESSPFLAPDDKTLYFSSAGYSGYGGTDIYVSRRLDSTWTKWSEPENLGPGINGELDDEFFVIPPTGDFAYYSKGITEENLDVFKISLPEFYRPDPVTLVAGKVLNKENNEPVEARIVYQRLEDGKVIGETLSDPGSGDYEIMLPSGEAYGFLAEAEDYLAMSENLDLTSQETYDEVERNLYLTPIKKGAVITLNNIFFDFDKSTLKPQSKPELDRLVEFMKKETDVKVQISGHTDSVGSEQYNEGLSGRRAQAVVDYLTNNDVEADRIVVKAFGESKPIADNSTAEGRAQNRRVEFEIVEAGE
ncbi:OmpA family protein [Marinigracilibium pacificum]|uniref:OmpA family protein n=1 Tax=Marinigracilibium pacificum TaxID=2729599 RepID=A0A848IRZ2_9BACT|nr:OmpA family protein [Marinigracilibium pacificum]NMM47117.1 OmpA family protein [Marinigracilibium pacificum]